MSDEDIRQAIEEEAIEGAVADWQVTPDPKPGLDEAILVAHLRQQIRDKIRTVLDPAHTYDVGWNDALHAVIDLLDGPRQSE